MSDRYADWIYFTRTGRIFSWISGVAPLKGLKTLDSVLDQDYYNFKFILLRTVFLAFDIEKQMWGMVFDICLNYMTWLIPNFNCYVLFLFKNKY